MPRRTERITAPPLQLDLIWEHGRLAGGHLCFAGQNTRPAEAQELSDTGRLILRELAAYVNGQKPAWPDAPLALESLSPFAAEVLDILRTRVPYGQTVTYGELAAMSGRPNAARAVGGVMARNPWPLLVPCHRVLGAKGALTGFSGDGGLELKAWLLRREGAPFKACP